MDLPSDLPSGTVTLLFSDIEASTRLWEEHPDEMRPALERHDNLVRRVIETNGGYVFKTVGDAFCAAFEEPVAALETALASQRLLADEAWPAGATIRVRMALHSGVCQERDGDYFGPTSNRAARILDLGHGGQVLVSGATAALLADALPKHATLRDLGQHRLKDLERPERIFQLCASELQDSFGPLQSFEGPRIDHNLPRRTTKFIGRHAELDEICGMVLDAGTGLVTLTGPGGVGKTRLALEVASRLVDEPGGGVWLVELAQVVASENVPRKIATVLGAREEPGRSVLDSVIDTCAGRDLTLVLDNCEHVVDASAEVADAVLRSCRNIRVLATSREPLGVEGERVHKVPALAFAPEDADPNDLYSYEALQLFAVRASNHMPGFVFGPGNAMAVASVCRRLDGIPLAIELAAARLRTMSVEEIERRLDARFRLLTGGARTGLAHHQTLRASIDWSYDLLDPSEQLLLDRLSVFVGGFEMSSAEEVCGREGPDRTLEGLGELVDKSLVEADQIEGMTRYRLLETVREYTSERLAARGESELVALRGAHRDHYLRLAEVAARMLREHCGVQWLDTLELEHANLRAALAFCLADAPSTEAGLRLASALRLFWSVRGHGVEALDVLDFLLDSQSDSLSDRPDPVPDALLAQALITAAYVLEIHGSYDDAVARAGRAVDLARTTGDENVLAEALLRLGSASRSRGELEAAIDSYDEALRVITRLVDKDAVSDPAMPARCAGGRAAILGDLGREEEAKTGLTESVAVLAKCGDRWDMSAMSCDLALLELRSGDHDEARSQLEKAFAITEDLGDEVHKSMVEVDLGLAALVGGDTAGASKWYSRAFMTARRTGNRTQLARTVTGLALVASASGEQVRAVSLHGAGETLIRQLRFAREPIEVDLAEDDRERLRAGMGVTEFDRAYEEGAALTDSELMVLALSPPAPHKQVGSGGLARTSR